ncbi:FtsB family cell division protein [Aestuariivirga litoralis]|uniref:FtsB family cell division protein n=1 Tax=Aestuariivirga litoralis TaxID=2650924 RepID=UPI0018C815DC|nr:septum formation initiator family protein [Aestuariivirga litoralis]MBG1231555.1 hypothetical protein [Aestuariivirga litoralis]
MGFILRHRLELLVSMSCLALMAYFALQATMGGRSYSDRAELTQRFAQLEDTLSNVTRERMALEDRVAQMRPGNVDADLLDEMARRTLNLGLENDVIVKF